jgi:hypothetical protein
MYFVRIWMGFDSTKMLVRTCSRATQNGNMMEKLNLSFRRVEGDEDDTIIF